MHRLRPRDPRRLIAKAHDGRNWLVREWRWFLRDLRDLRGEFESHVVRLRAKRLSSGR